MPEGQKSLLDPQANPQIEGEVEPPAVDAEAEEVSGPPAIVAPGLVPMTFHDGAALLPVEEQRAVLAEYGKRHQCFIDWLLSQLVEGIHYGVPPGCEPRGTPDPRQWQAKPSLYKAGALLVANLLKLSPRFEADQAAWTQLGKPEQTFVFKCELWSASAGKVIGEGRGTYAVGEKKMPANSAIKLAEKRALSDAIINSIPGMADLFTQDREDVAETAKARRTDTPHEAQGAKPPVTDSSYVQKGVNKLFGEWKRAGRDWGQATGDAKEDDGVDFRDWCESVLRKTVPTSADVTGQELQQLQAWFKTNKTRRKADDHGTSEGAPDGG